MPPPVPDEGHTETVSRPSGAKRVRRRPASALRQEQLLSDRDNFMRQIRLEDHEAKVMRDRLAAFSVRRALQDSLRLAHLIAAQKMGH